MSNLSTQTPYLGNLISCYPHPVTLLVFFHTEFSILQTQLKHWLWLFITCDLFCYIPITVHLNNYVLMCILCDSESAHQFLSICNVMYSILFLPIFWGHVTFFSEYLLNRSFADQCSYAIQNQHKISFQMVYNMTMSLKVHISPYWTMSQFAAIMIFQISRQRRLLCYVYPIFFSSSSTYLTPHVEKPSKKINFYGTYRQSQDYTPWKPTML